MRIDRSHTPWVVFVIAATGGSALLYLANFRPQLLPFPVRLPAFLGEVPPSRNTFGGTPLGLIFGSVAFFIFLFAAALGIRKKKRTWPIGNVQFWLKAHIWLSILTIPLVLFHCGFHLGGKQTTVLMALYTIVMASGFFGLALQQFMPRLMRERLPREVVFEEIPYLRLGLLEKATKIRNEISKLETECAPRSESSAVAAGAPPRDSRTRATAAPEDSSCRVLGGFLDKECLPYLAASRGDRAPLGDAMRAAEIFRKLKVDVTQQWQSKVEELQASCTERRLMDLQTKLQHWLHGWLIIHVPSSFALLILTGWHAVVAVRFILLPH